MANEPEKTLEDFANEIADLAIQFRDASDDATVKDVMALIMDIIVDATIVGATLMNKSASIFLGEIAGVFLQNEMKEVSRQMRAEALRQHIADTMRMEGNGND